MDCHAAYVLSIQNLLKKQQSARIFSFTEDAKELLNNIRASARFLQAHLKFITKRNDSQSASNTERASMYTT